MAFLDVSPLPKIQRKTDPAHLAPLFFYEERRGSKVMAGPARSATLPPAPPAALERSLQRPVRRKEMKRLFLKRLFFHNAFAASFIGIKKAAGA